jgi:hypothetical protein
MKYMFTIIENLTQMTNSQNIYIIYIIHSVYNTSCNIIHRVIYT